MTDGASRRRIPAGKVPVRTEALLVLALTAAIAVAYLAARDATPFQIVEGAALD